MSVYLLGVYTVCLFTLLVYACLTLVYCGNDNVKGVVSAS